MGSVVVWVGFEGVGLTVESGRRLPTEPLCETKGARLKTHQQAHEDRDLLTLSSGWLSVPSLLNLNGGDLGEALTSGLLNPSEAWLGEGRWGGEVGEGEGREWLTLLCWS